MRTELTGNPYLTQTELKEDEQRQLFAKVYTATPELFREATDEEIAEVQARIEVERVEMERVEMEGETPQMDE